MPHCHCAKTMLGTLKVNPHCAVHGTEYDLGASRVSQMGFAPKPKNLVQNYEPTNQDMTWFKGRVKTLHNELHTEKMSQIHNLGSARRVQMIGNIIPEIDGRTAGVFFTSAIVGNTLIAKALGKKWLESFDVGLMTTGFATTVAGAFASSKGIREDNTNLLAAGGALTGLGLFYYLAGRSVL